jgi:hypothetical protein
MDTNPARKFKMSWTGRNHEEYSNTPSFGAGYWSPGGCECSLREDRWHHRSGPQFKIKWMKSTNNSDYFISWDEQQIEIQDSNGVIIYSGNRKQINSYDAPKQFDDLNFMYKNCVKYYESNDMAHGPSSFNIALLNDGRVMVVVIAGSGLVHLCGAVFRPVS